MSRPKRMIDLCSGFGGASEEFLVNGWDVMRVENNPLLLEVPSTWEMDLTDDLDVDALIHMPYWDETDFIWASPPCLEFSQGYNAPGPTAKREGKEFEPDLTILRNCLKIIKAKRPKYWCIENVAGASKIFSKEMGVNAPRQIIGPYFLWGNFPYVSMPRDWERPKGKTQDWNIGDPLRANKRAIIPIEVSRAFFREMTEQDSLWSWIA